MRIFKISVDVRETVLSELPDDDRLLVEAAKLATRRSYSPYSRFRVGAAIRMADGSVATGSNQENAAYPSGLCAERTAAFHASSESPGLAMRKIAVAAHSGDLDPDDDAWEEGFQALPISPCGACRQVLLEYEVLHGPIEVILYGREKTFIFPSVESLLPFSFTRF